MSSIKKILIPNENGEFFEANYENSAKLEIVSTKPEKLEPNTIYVLTKEDDVDLDTTQMIFVDDKGTQAIADLEEPLLFLPDASLTSKGVVQLTNDINLDDETIAASAKSIKTINDKISSINNDIASIQDTLGKINITEFAGEFLEVTDV